MNKLILLSIGVLVLLNLSVVCIILFAFSILNMKNYIYFKLLHVRIKSLNQDRYHQPLVVTLVVLLALETLVIVVD